MPELPDVEHVRLLAEDVLVGRRIAAVTARPDPIVMPGASPVQMAAALRGRRVLATRRKGKHFWLELDRRPWLAIHLGMTGWLDAYDEAAQRPRFWKLELVTSEGRRLAYSDARRFGRLRLQQDPAAEPPICDLGFDALHELPPAADLHRQLARRPAAIKAVLLDQSLFAGVGNWIADEVLYQAGIDPHRPARGLSVDEVRALRLRLRTVLQKAVAVGADSDRFPRTWLFHHRWGRRPGARTARAERIRHDTIGGRTTAWVPGRQH